MYTEFFNLKIKPFELVPNPTFLYQSHSHKKALNYLKFGLYELAGFILLTGEVGSGKTTIVRNIINEMGSDVALSMIFNTRVSNKQVLAMINDDFGLSVAGKDKMTLLRNLNDYLVSIHAQKRRAVVIIDEAQNLSVSALEEIRLLSNLEATDVKLLQIVLVGQPELNKTIARHELRQLRQRISVHVQIAPLSRAETEDYIYYRLEIAGNRNALTWQDGTFDELFKYSHGIPRLINIYCDFLLLAACVEGTTTLSVEFVQDVLGEVSWDKEVAEYEIEHQTNINNLQRQNLVERLSAYENRIAAVESLLAQRYEISRELRAQQELLMEILESQQNAFRHMQGELERTCGLMNDVLAKDNLSIENSDDDNLDDKGSKGLLNKLFT